MTGSYEVSPAAQLAVQEAARCFAILEAIEGAPRYLLNHRSRISRQLGQWLEKVSAAIDHRATSEPKPIRADFPDYVRALQRIALGEDATATVELPDGQLALAEPDFDDRSIDLADGRLLEPADATSRRGWSD